MHWIFRSLSSLTLLFIAGTLAAFSQSSTYWWPAANGDNSKGPVFNTVHFMLVDAESKKILSIKEDELTVLIAGEHPEYEFETAFDGRSSRTKPTGNIRTIKDEIRNKAIFYVYESTPNITLTIERPGYKTYTKTLAPHYSIAIKERQEVISYPSKELKAASN
ncbi:MAG: hypothetical protein ACM3Q4_08800 [Acidobacteriota bacterium]